MNECVQGRAILQCNLNTVWVCGLNYCSSEKGSDEEEFSGRTRNLGSHKCVHVFDQLLTINFSRKIKLRGVIELSHN
jgi:hypothetical protein